MQRLRTLAFSNIKRAIFPLADIQNIKIAAYIGIAIQQTPENIAIMHKTAGMAPGPLSSASSISADMVVAGS